jgi:hypothetical protein
VASELGISSARCSNGNAVPAGEARFTSPTVGLCLSYTYLKLNVKNRQLCCCVRALVAGRGNVVSSRKNALRVGGGAEIGVCLSKSCVFFCLMHISNILFYHAKLTDSPHINICFNTWQAKGLSNGASW